MNSRKSLPENMRMLNTNEFSCNSALGYLSLTQALPEGSSLAVAFEYTLDGKKYKVDQFSADVPDDPKSRMLFP